MGTAEKYLEILKEREPQLWPGPLVKSTFTEKDILEIENGLDCRLPDPYRNFLLSYKMPEYMTVLVSFCGDSFACSWSETFSHEKQGYIPRPEHDIGPTVELDWHNIKGDSGAEFLQNLHKEQDLSPEAWPCFLAAGFIEIGEVYGYKLFLNLLTGKIHALHEEAVYDMAIIYHVDWANPEKVRKHMQGRLCICKDFNDFLRFVCTGDYLDEDEGIFPTEEELASDYFN